MDILLTSEQYIKDNSTISENLSPRYITSCIAEAQELKLMPIIGAALFHKLQNLVKDGTITATGNEAYKTLMDDYIQKFLMWQVKVDLVHEISYKKNNSGLTNTNGDKITVVSKAEIISDQNYSIAKADSYADRMQRYLLDNKASFPELNENILHEIKSQLHSSATCSIFLGGARGKKIRR